MNHSEFYHLGNRLTSSLGNPAIESEIRNIIGRLYYYVYHEILIWVKSDETLLNLYRSSTEKGSHNKLYDAFFQYAKSTQELKYGTIKRLLCDLHDSRCLCDYKLNESVNASIIDEFHAVLLELKEVVQHVRKSVFSAVVSEELQIEEVLVTENFTAKVVKKQKHGLRILD